MKRFIPFLILMSVWIPEAVVQAQDSPGGYDGNGNFIDFGGPPTEVTATAGDRSITVTWQPPSYLGSYNLVQYNIGIRSRLWGANPSVEVTAPGGSSARSHTITETGIDEIQIKNGQEYSINAAAIYDTSSLVRGATRSKAASLSPVANRLRTL